MVSHGKLEVLKLSVTISRKKNEKLKENAPKRITTKSLLMLILIRYSKGGNKLKFFTLKKSVEFELLPHPDLTLFKKKLTPFLPPPTTR